MIGELLKSPEITMQPDKLELGNQFAERQRSGNLSPAGTVEVRQG